MIYDLLVSAILRQRRGYLERHTLVSRLISSSILFQTQYNTVSFKSYKIIVPFHFFSWRPSSRWSFHGLPTHSTLISTFLPYLHLPPNFMSAFVSKWSRLLSYHLVVPWLSLNLTNFKFTCPTSPILYSYFVFQYNPTFNVRYNSLNIKKKDSFYR